MSSTQTEAEPRAALFNGSMIGLLCAVLAIGAVTLASALLSRIEAAAAFMAYWPLLLLAVSIALVVTLITVVKLHAFVALMLAAIAAGLMAQVGVLTGKPESSHWVRAVELATTGFGNVCADVGLVIVLAAIIGMCLLESGAADKVVRWFLRMFGQQRAGLALLASTYIVSIPIFFDTIFMLLIPLARALRLRTGRDYTLYVMAICCASVVTHSMVIPHPGPTAMANDLRLDAGLTIVVGLITGVIPVAVGWFVCKWINRRVDVPLVETAGSSLADLEALMNRDEADLPPLWLSLTPVLLPVMLIGGASFVTALSGSERGALAGWMQFLGHKNIALFIATFISIFMLMKQRRVTFAQVGQMIGPPLQVAGIVILITAAGGAFGFMLRNAGVGKSIMLAVGGYPVNLIVLSWVVAIIIRIAQGSATVAMLTTSAMMYPMVVGQPLPYHPVYIFLGIGYGALGVSWMNDSGFWLVGKLGGFSEKQTLRSWTVLLFMISVTGLITALVLAWIMPEIPFVVRPDRRM